MAEAGGEDPEYVDIKGILWIDEKTTKTRVYDNVYDPSQASDKLLTDVQVRLRNNNSVVSTINTKTGQYEFLGSDTHITKSTLQNYYIELYYEGLKTQYTIVQYGTTNNASKAIDYDSNTGTAKTNAISSDTHLNMNIGLRRIANPTGQTVQKNIKSIEVKMNDEYNYEYTFATGNETYNRKLYASDIIYSIQDEATEKLEVYVTYTITVTNTTQTIDGQWNENHMTVNIQDVYDKEQYILIEKNGWSGSNGIAICTVNNLLSNQSWSSDIIFKLHENTLEDILHNGSFSAGNKVIVTGHHNYNLWEIIGWTPANRLHTSQPIYDWGRTRTLNYKMDEYAEGINFYINEENERKISGYVFKDNNTRESTKEIIGNGIFDKDGVTKENVVKGVKVDLLDENKNVATRYVYNPEIEGKYEIYSEATGNAQDETDEFGYYEFTGVIPR